MKTNLKFLSTVCLSMLFFCFTDFKACGQVYVFPVLQGTAQWKSFKTHQEMLKACQIPENILKNMSTADLIQTCLNYPLIGDVYAYSNVKNGIENISKQFNGFAELFTRNDNFNSLMSEFEQSRLILNDNLVSNKSDAEKGKIMLIFAIIESFLSFDAVLSKSDYNQKRQLAGIADEILNYKLKNRDKFGGLSITSTAFMLGKTLQKMNKFSKITPNTEKFLNNNIIADNSVVSEIVQTFNNSEL